MLDGIEVIYEEARNLLANLNFIIRSEIHTHTHTQQERGLKEGLSVSDSIRFQEQYLRSVQKNAIMKTPSGHSYYQFW